MNAKFFELPDAKQAKILNGTLKTFAKMGYRKASTNDIAKESGISKSLLFHYFGTKSELFSYMFNYSIDLVVKSLQGFKYKKKEDLFDMIRRSNEIKLGLFKKYPYLYRFIYQSYFDDDPEVKAIIKKRNDMLLLENSPDILAHMDQSMLKDGIPAEKVLQIILWVSEGFLQNKLNTNDIDPDKLHIDFEEWMGILKHCFYK
jgi:TetR/AcrR family transcriptional regulator